MTLSNSAKFFLKNADGTGGFADEMACVTKPGEWAVTASHLTWQVTRRVVSLRF